MATTPNFGWTTPNDTDYVKDGASAIRTLGNAIDASMADLEGGTTGQVLSKNSNADMDFVWVTQDDANAIQNTIVDAKGDLITATAADTPARLPVGTNGQYLQADSTTATGLKWAAVGGGIPVVSAQQTFSAVNTVSLSNIFSSTYDNYRLLIQITSGNDVELRMRFRTTSDDTSSQYYYQLGCFRETIYTVDNWKSGGAAAFSVVCGAYGTATAMSMDVYGPNLAERTNWTAQGNTYSSPSYRTTLGSGMMYTTTQYTGITLYTSDGSNIAGRVAVYGYNKS